LTQGQKWLDAGSSLLLEEGDKNPEYVLCWANTGQKTCPEWLQMGDEGRDWRWASACGSGVCTPAASQGLDMLPCLLCPKTFLAGAPALM